MPRGSGTPATGCRRRRLRGNGGGVSAAGSPGSLAAGWWWWWCWWWWWWWWCCCCWRWRRWRWLCLTAAIDQVDRAGVPRPPAHGAAGDRQRRGVLRGVRRERKPGAVGADAVHVELAAVEPRRGGRPPDLRAPGAVRRAGGAPAADLHARRDRGTAVADDGQARVLGAERERAADEVLARGQVDRSGRRPPGRRVERVVQRVEGLRAAAGRSTPPAHRGRGGWGTGGGWWCHAQAVRVLSVRCGG